MTTENKLSKFSNVSHNNIFSPLISRKDNRRIDFLERLGKKQFTESLDSDENHSKTSIMLDTQALFDVLVRIAQIEFYSEISETDETTVID